MVICLSKNRKNSLEAMKNNVNNKQVSDQMSDQSNPFLVLCVFLALGNAHLEWRGTGLGSSQKWVSESLNIAFGSSGEHQELSRSPSFLRYLGCQDCSSPFWSAADKLSHTLHPKSFSFSTHIKISVANSAQEELPPASGWRGIKLLDYCLVVSRLLQHRFSPGYSGLLLSELVR